MKLQLKNSSHGDTVAYLLRMHQRGVEANALISKVVLEFAGSSRKYVRIQSSANWSKRMNRAKEETKFPTFPPYACIGDKITWVVDGLLLTATVKCDDRTEPEDFEIDLPEVVQSWKNDEWFYCSIVISVEKQGIMIEDHAASLWGIECNFPGSDNSYLSEVAQDLESEAVTAGKEELQRMIQVLQS